MKEISIKVVTRIDVPVPPTTHTQDEYLAMCDKASDKKPIHFELKLSQEVETTYVINTDCNREDTEVVEYFKKGLQNAGVDVVSITQV